MAQRFPSRPYGSQQGMQGQFRNTRPPGPRPNRNIQNTNFDTPSQPYQSSGGSVSMTDMRQQGAYVGADVHGQNRGASNYPSDRNMPYQRQDSTGNRSSLGANRDIYNTGESVQAHSYNRDGLDSLPNRDFHSSSNDRGSQSHSYNKDFPGQNSNYMMQNKPQNKGPMHSEPNRFPQDSRNSSFQDRTFQGSTPDRQNYSSMQNSGAQTSKHSQSYSGMQDQMFHRQSGSNRVMPGQSDQTMQGFRPDINSNNPPFNRSAQGNIPSRDNYGQIAGASDKNNRYPKYSGNTQGRDNYSTASERHDQGQFPEENQQHHFSDSRQTQGHFPDNKQTQGHFSDNRQTQGHFQVNRQTQGNFQDNRHTQGSFPDSKQIQGHFSDNRHTQGHFPDNRQTQSHFPDNRHTQGNFPDNKQTQGHFSDNRQTQGHFSDNRQTQGHFSDNRQTQGHFSDNRQTQGHFSDNRHTQGNFPDNKQTQGHFSDNRQTQGHFSDNRQTQGHFSDNRHTQGHFPDKRHTQGNFQDSRQAQGHFPGNIQTQGNFRDNRQTQGDFPDNRHTQGHFPDNRQTQGYFPENRQTQGYHGHSLDRPIPSQNPDRGSHDDTSDRNTQGHYDVREMQSNLPGGNKQYFPPERDVPNQFNKDNASAASNRGPGISGTDRMLDTYQNVPTAQVNILPGNNQFSVPPPVQFTSNVQGQLNPTSIPPGTIVQHVMIPVPVPIGTQLPSQLLRPQVIASNISHQGNFVGQGQNQFPEIQSQCHFTDMALKPTFQGQGSTSNIQMQENLSSPFNQYPGPGPRLPTPNKTVGTNQDELSYYMDNQTHKRKLSEDTSWNKYDDRTNRQKDDGYNRHADQTGEHGSQHYDRNELMEHDHDRERTYGSRSRGSSEQSDRSRREESRNVVIKEQNKRFKRQDEPSVYPVFKHNVEMKHEYPDRYDVNHEHFNRETDIQSNRKMSHDSGNYKSERYDWYNKESETSSNRANSRPQNEYDRNVHPRNEQQFINYKDQEASRLVEVVPKKEDVFDDSRRYENVSSYDRNESRGLRCDIKNRPKHDEQFENKISDTRKVYHSNSSSFKIERHILHMDEKKEEKTNGTNDDKGEIVNLGRRSDTILYTDGKRENEGSETKDKEIEKNERQGAVLLVDGKLEDLNRDVELKEENKIGTDHTASSSESGKRKLSPENSEETITKLKRDNSPVSVNKSHDLKIHISESGRWIETETKKSPVQEDTIIVKDEEFEIIDECDDGSDVDDVVEKDEVTSVDGAEMISDSESCIGDDNATSQLENVSPDSQLSPGANKNEDSVGKDELSDKEGHDKKGESEESKQSEGKLEKKKTQDSETKKKVCHSSNRKSREYHLKVPDLCQYNLQKGCSWGACRSLHICRFFILDSCKFKYNCTKGHDFFKGQPFKLLSEMNPGFASSTVTAEQIKLILKHRISTLHMPEDLSHRLTTYKTTFIDSSESDNDEKEDEVDPTFDARNYVAGSNFPFDAFKKRKTKDKKTTKKKTETLKASESTKAKDESEKINEKTVSDKSTKSGKEDKGKKVKRRSTDIDKAVRKKSKQDTGTKKKTNVVKAAKTGHLSKSNETKDDDSLSSISGDEDDWEKYEKYEKISDDELSEKDVKDDLDNVSSDESSIEMVQVNRSVDTFPLPTPENIAVPIGMNDPLVFNRPLKNNPQSYVAPLNRPPPMFPITPDSKNMPLFPANQNVQQMNANVPMPGLPIRMPGVLPTIVPNHLPSPEFMQHVIHNLPTFKEQPEENTDKKPPVAEPELQKKIKSDKCERNPELKETIKKLWKFPHKHMFNMSVIEFVTETVAYKEELVAEIIRILVTLELPYVTMKKLISVIKEKALINIKSETDMRKILDMYPNNFKIIETVDSDDENDDADSKKNVKIKANTGLGFCEKHGFLPFAIGKCECNQLHLCKFYFLTDCPNKLCKFGHKLKTDHNVTVLRQHKLHRLTGEELMKYMSDVENRSKETVPSICKYYIREKGCYKGDNTDYDTICHSLHLCSYVLKGRCLNHECDKSHSIRDKQPLSLLQKYGLDPCELGDETVLEILSEKALESDKDRSKKTISVKQGQQGKSGSKNLSAKSGNKGTSIPGEGISILTHSETRVSSKYYVQNFKIPAVCKFYQNEMGCRKKDWGSDGKCFFLHICQHYVTGDCKFGNKCKRSHDLFSGQAAEILEKYNFDLEIMSSSDVLKRLNNSGEPVELPKSAAGSDDRGSVEAVKQGEGYARVDQATFEKARHSEVAKSVVSKKGQDMTTRNRGRNKPSVAQTSHSYGNRDIEDVIKHIMEHNKVDKK